MSDEESDGESVRSRSTRRSKSNWKDKNFHQIKGANAKRAASKLGDFGHVPVEELRERGRQGRAQQRAAGQTTEDINEHGAGIRERRPLAVNEAIDMEAEPAAASGGNQMGTAIGSSGLVRAPQDHTLTADGIKFSQVYHLILRTMAPKIWNKAFTANQTAPVRCLYLCGMYQFDPGQMRQYLTPAQASILRNLPAANLKVSRIWGRAKVLGPGAPFIANTTATAATNSQITMSRMTNRGIDKVIPLVGGQVVQPDIGVDITSFTPVTEKTVGSKDAEWWRLQEAKLAADLPAAGGLTAVSSPAADLGFVKYDFIAGIPFSNLEKQRQARVPQVGKLMGEQDIKNNAGDLFSFEEHPDFYLRTQTLAISNATINQDYNTQVTLPATAGACTAALQSGTTVNNSYISNTNYDAYIVSSNTFMAGGAQHIAQHALDKHYVYLVPPPTTDESLIQEANMYITYECGMEVSLRADMINQTNNTFALGTGRIMAGSTDFVGNQVFATPITSNFLF